MAHEVETGVFNIERGLPWHGLGNPAQGFMTAEEILRQAELDWEVEKRPLFVQSSTVDPFFDPTEKFLGVPDFYGVVRTKDDSTLGVVGNRYVPAQNVEVLSIMDSIIGPGQASYDTAWSLRGGKTVAITAELGRQIVPAPGEEIRTFLTATNNHDGQGKIRYIVSPVRVVCMNTLAMASSQAKFTWERKHTVNALSEGSVAEAREALSLAHEYQNYIEATAKELLSETFSKGAFEAYAEALIYPEEVRLGEKDPSKQSLDRLEELLAVYANTDNLENIRGTKWGALQAVVDFADYHTNFRGRYANDNRTASILSGDLVQFKTKAFEMLKSA